MKFKSFWKKFIADNYDFSKADSRLSKEEVLEVQKFIKKLLDQKKPASVIIKKLQDYNDKLSDYYKAKRAFDTENKAIQTNEVLGSADDLGIDKFQCILSPNACTTCRQKTANGEKIFKESDLTKSGYGNKPPFHPSCFCVLIPYL